MISVRKSLEHLAWSDDKFFGKLADISVESYQLSLKAGEKTVGELARHIVGGAEWLRFLLTGLVRTDLKVPTSNEEMATLRQHLAQLNKSIFEEANIEDDLLSFEDTSGDRKTSRATVISQAVLHSAEHKAQIVATLVVHGITSINLDNYDLWHLPYIP